MAKTTQWNHRRDPCMHADRAVPMFTGGPPIFRVVTGCANPSIIPIPSTISTRGTMHVSDWSRSCALFWASTAAASWQCRPRDEMDSAAPAATQDQPRSITSFTSWRVLEPTVWIIVLPCQDAFFPKATSSLFLRPAWEIPVQAHVTPGESDTESSTSKKS